ncbi:hypothetical protein JCM31826_06830 [Thermaurantimonas aggregans]|uniref:DUF1015 domain-containing protein n=1 Tax=Thermaurantimonas aggregans TaxID=2173829 RepID=A0A401XJP5_9FLAO|nr:DUF1015 domain-containing protein [Thermaurantimonas aggregans]GCD77201.1 hypothetical protein JCM31826_06830 [Thermaurantimonas aggregans]
MIDFRPFKAIRPTRDKAYLVATRSYVSYSEQALIDKLNNNPYTFLHVINPEEARVHNIQGTEKYKLVRKTFKNFYRDGIFIADERPAFYLYRQSTPLHVFTGLIGAVSVFDYNEGRIKIHEHTLTRREEMFADYLYHTGFNAEPVLMMYPWKMKLHQVFERYLLMRPEYEFTSTDKVLHELWVIDDANSLETIRAAFSEIEAVYIADGHHRSASSALLYKRLLSEGTASNESGYFMAMMLPETELVIDSFFRLLENSSAEEQKKIEEFIHSSCQEITSSQPVKSGEISIFNGIEWKTFKIPTEWFVGKDAAKQLDASVLFDHILHPIAGIADAKESERLHYMPTPEGRKKAENWAKEHPYSLIFELAPINVETIKKIADLQLVMPPKSTYILPKLRSGLTIYDLNIH